MCMGGSDQRAWGPEAGMSGGVAGGTGWSRQEEGPWGMAQAGCGGQQLAQCGSGPSTESG